MQLDAGQIALIGVVCTVLIYLIRLIAAWTGLKLTLPMIGIVSVVISGVLSLLFLWKQLPPLDTSDPMAFVVQLVQLITLVTGTATLIYNVVLETLLKALKIDPTTIANRRMTALFRSHPVN